MFFCLLSPTGASAEEEDELYERGVVESNCVYRLVENRLVPHEQAWASIPSISLLGSTEVCGLFWILLLLDRSCCVFFLICFRSLQVCFNSWLSVCVSRPWCLISAVRCTCGMDRMFHSAGGLLLSSWLTKCGLELMTTATVESIHWIPHSVTPAYSGEFLLQAVKLSVQTSQQKITAYQYSDTLQKQWSTAVCIYYTYWALWCAQ